MHYKILKFQSRGIYESPGATILYKAHQDLEIFLLDREVLRIKSYLTNRMSDYVYNGKKIDEKQHIFASVVNKFIQLFTLFRFMVFT